VKEIYTLDDLRDWPRVTAECEPPVRLAVIGDPVAHSRSPQIHNAALAALGIPARYARIHVRPTEVETCLSLLPRMGFLGINCTIPHKGSVLAAIPGADAVARRAGGVNTVVVNPDGSLTGTSTDGPGFARAVKESFGRELSDLRVMILGAGGGAGRAVAMECAAAGCPSVMLINRSLDKLEVLLDALAEHFPEHRAAAGSFDEIFLRAGLAASDLVVNCTALGMKPGDASPIPSSLLKPHHLIYDTIYVAHRTPLLAAGDKVGAKGVNGLSMLLHQGALSFERWFQQPAPLEIMRVALAAT
jgi:shikimate dehydrogenase